MHRLLLPLLTPGERSHQSLDRSVVVTRPTPPPSNQDVPPGGWKDEGGAMPWRQTERAGCLSATIETRP